MLRRGEDSEAVRELSGCLSGAVTKRIYAHALLDRKRRAAESRGFLVTKKYEFLKLL